MERQVDLTRWAEFEAWLEEIRAADAAAGSDRGGTVSHLLFRGQSSDEWQLETTLDRARPAFTLLADYYRIAAIAKTQIETFTPRTWEAVDYPKIARLLEQYEGLFGSLPNYDYLVYLRHHGFPSPLLDWTRSPYIAAFFAFQRPIGNRIAIFVYQEHTGKGKLSSSGEPRLHVLGPNVRSHPRHFLQQGEYTLCAQYTDGNWLLGRHADVFNLARENQDRLWKVTLPGSEGATTMRKLEQYNITAFSLFQSEEALLETLARKLVTPKSF